MDIIFASWPSSVIDQNVDVGHEGKGREEGRKNGGNGDKGDKVPEKLERPVMQLRKRGEMARNSSR